MRTLVIFRKSVREQLRNLWVLFLTLAFAPVFVYAYWLFFPSGGSTAYGVLVINKDDGADVDGELYAGGEEAIEAIRGVSYADGSPMLTVETVPDRATAQEQLRDRQGHVYIIIPENFSQSLVAFRSGERPGPAELEFGGDLTNPYYMVAAILAVTAVDGYVQAASGQMPLVNYVEEPMGGSGTRTEFEVYVPGMFIFAIEMLVFTAAMTVAREVENGTLRRIKLGSP